MLGSGADGHPLAPRGLLRAALRGAGRPPGRVAAAGLAGEADRARHGHATVRIATTACIVPNEYDLHLHPADFATFASYRGSLEDDLAHRVLSRARHERYTPGRPPAGPHPVRPVGPAAGRPRGGQRRRRRGRARSRDDKPVPASSDTVVFARPGARGAAPDSAQRAYLLVQDRWRAAGPVRPGRRADQHRPRQRQRRDRRRRAGQPPPLPAQAAARRLQLRRPGQPQRLVRERAAGQRDRAGAGRRDPHRHRRRSSSRCADDRGGPPDPAPRPAARRSWASST